METPNLSNSYLKRNRDKIVKRYLGYIMIYECISLIFWHQKTDNLISKRGDKRSARGYPVGLQNIVYN
jgi:hypothetical protein